MVPGPVYKLVKGIWAFLRAREMCLRLRASSYKDAWTCVRARTKVPGPCMGSHTGQVTFVWARAKAQAPLHGLVQ
eukprot:7782888-Alexandrium_andersonii.AAC.1